MPNLYQVLCQASRANSECDEAESNNLDEIEDLVDDDEETNSATLAKTDSATTKDEDLYSSEAENSFDDLDNQKVESISNQFENICLNSVQEKAELYKTLATSEIIVSKKTETAVKMALSKHKNPVACDICGEFMKNERGVKLHKAKKHNNQSFF